MRRHALSKKTFQAAAAADAHLIVQIKDNQPTLYREVEAVCATAASLSSGRSLDENRRNRHETRAVAERSARLGRQLRRAAHRQVDDAGAFDEVLRYGDLDTRTRLMVQLASMIAGQVPSGHTTSVRLIERARGTERVTSRLRAA